MSIQVHTPFVTAICVKDFSRHLESAGLWFEENKALFDRSVDNGFDTTLNQYYSNEDNIIAGTGVEDFIVDAEDFAVEFMQHSGYATDKWTPKMHRIWLNTMPSGSVHTKHAHYGSVLSGCFYLTLPEGSSQIRFYNPAESACKPNIPIQQYTVFNSDSWTLYPKEGEAFLWPSNIAHDVPPSDFAGVRRSVAFDLILKAKDVV